MLRRIGMQNLIQIYNVVEEHFANWSQSAELMLSIEETHASVRQC